jgi:glutamyl-tRNA reductase
MELARRFNAGTIPFTQVPDNLKEVDIVLSSTGSPETILNMQDVRPRMRERRNRPLFLIDIAVPRDIDPRINELDNVYLYDIDDLQGIVDLNRGERLKEAEKAEHIIEMETVSFQRWFQTLEVVPTIIALRRKAETIREAELRKTFAHLDDLDDRQREAVTVLTEAIVRKLLHDPILFLKKKSHRESKKLYVDFTQQLFNLSDGNGSDLAEPSQELL